MAAQVADPQVVPEAPVAQVVADRVAAVDRAVAVLPAVGNNTCFFLEILY